MSLPGGFPSGFLFMCVTMKHFEKYVCHYDTGMGFLLNKPCMNREFCLPLQGNKRNKRKNMNYKISKETAAIVDAVKAVRNIHGMVYDALMQTYDEETVIKMMESGFNGALDALQNEVCKFLNQSIITHVDEDGSTEI